jgi:hypothetical protein
MGESTLAKKLGIKPGRRLLLLRIPEGYRQLLGVLPEGATVAETAGGTFDYEAGFGPVTQIAIDEVWSALRFRPREK